MRVIGRRAATLSGGAAQRDHVDQRDQVDAQIELGREPMQSLDASGDRIVEGDLADAGARAAPEPPPPPPPERTGVQCVHAALNAAPWGLHDIPYARARTIPRAHAAITALAVSSDPLRATGPTARPARQPSRSGSDAPPA